MATFLTDRLPMLGGRGVQKSTIEFEFDSQLIFGPPFGDAGRGLRIVVLDLCSNPKGCLYARCARDSSSPRLC